MLNSTRKSGGLKILIGFTGLLILGIHAYHFVLPEIERFTSLLLLPFIALGVYSLIGLFELVTATRFERIAAAWERLAGWQRGIIGTGAVVTLTALIIYCVPLLLRR